MPSGLIFVYLVYPDLLHVRIPSSYFLTTNGKRACIQFEQHNRLLHLIDPTNYMNAVADNATIFTPHLNISPQLINGRHYQVGIGGSVSHSVSFDGHDRFSRSSQTRYATNTIVIYEVNDITSLETDEMAFYISVMNDFVHAYRYLRGDERPRLISDCREPRTVDIGVVEYSTADTELPIDERLGAPREIQLQKHQDHYVYDRQPHNAVSADRITEIVSAFFKENNHITPGQEFLSMAKHAGLNNKNFKYAILEAFISAETLIGEFLRDIKQKKGVSRKKMKEWDKQIGIGYKLNIELSMMVDDVTKEDRQTLGEVDRVRRMRNDIVHEGKAPTEQDAQFALKAVEKLHEALRRWVREGGCD